MALRITIGAIAALGFVAVLAGVSPSEAQVRVVERQAPSEPEVASDRGGILLLGGGLNTFFDNQCGTYKNCARGVGGWLGAEIGGHVAPVDEHPGLFLTASVALYMGAAWAGRVGVRLGFDIQLYATEDAEIAVLLTPSVLAGFSLAWLDANSGPYGLVVIEPALDVHVLLDRGAFGVWLRPGGFDLQFLGAFSARWNLVGGVQWRW